MPHTVEAHLAPLANSCSRMPLADVQSLRNAIKNGRNSSSNGRWLTYNDMLKIVDSELQAREVVKTGA